MISDDYRRLNAALHESNSGYGTSGQKYAGDVRGLVKEYGLATILDFGCGKGTLKHQLPGFDVREYDPAIPGKDAPPEMADLVTCTDVMEHIEPEHLDAVLGELKRLSKKLVYLVIATVPATKTLADGRNAHLIVQSSAWWRAKLGERFQIIEWRETPSEVTAVAVPLGAEVPTPVGIVGRLARATRKLVSGRI